MNGRHVRQVKRPEWFGLLAVPAVFALAYVALCLAFSLGVIR